MENKKTPQPGGTTGTPSVEILLSDISIGSQPRTEFDQDKTKELAESIKVHGVLQAIRVRPVTGGKKKYELVFGERRYRASLLAGKTTIPATVREMTDAEVMDVQIIENLQREDISPLEEAAFFKKILDTGKINVQELCKRIGKEKDYINRRMRLNELIPEFRKLLHDDKILLGHAFVLYLLPAHEQLEYYKKLVDEKAIDLIHKQTVAQLQEDINQEIVRKLDSAPFKITDPALVPAAGACTTCPKASTSNPDLFGLDKGSARCFDKTCFKNKSDVAFTIKLDEAIKDPNVILVSAHWGDLKLAEELKKKGHTVLTEYSHFNTTSKSTPGAKKAFFVAGHEKGKYAYIKLNERKASGSGVKLTAKEQQESNEKKIAEGRLRDKQIILQKISDRFAELPQYEDGSSKAAGDKLKPAEQAAIMLMVLDKADDFEFEDVLKVKDDDWAGALEKAKPEIINKIVRGAIFNFIIGRPTDGPDASALRLIGNAYFPKEIAQWEAEQAEVRKAREAKLTGKAEPMKKPITKSKSK